LTTNITSNTLHIALPITDDSGIYKAFVTYTELNDQANSGEWKSAELTGAGECATGQHTYSLDLTLTREVNYFIQVMDCAGNVSVKLNNGKYYDKTYITNKSLTFTSTGAQDGWVLESGENTKIGRTLNSAGSTFRLGDDAARKQYRGILSFSTGASLPDTAVITKVTLKVRKQGIFGGGNPVTTFKGFMVDIKRGYFGTSALQAADFQTAASKTYGPFKPAPVGDWYTIDLTGGNTYINKLSTASGLTQIRLRFYLDDNNNNTSNYLNLYSGNASSSYRPQLVIEYYVP
jgi:hypothetical protein